MCEFRSTNVRWKVPVMAMAMMLGHAASAQTQISTDGKVGSAGAKALLGTPSSAPVKGNGGREYQIKGNVFTVDEGLGQKVGRNLFHSFERFSIGKNDAAIFTTDSADLLHVISRVTGSDATRIEGILALRAAQGSAPDFYFINPNGVALGAGAIVDVPGALHLSTAHRMLFGKDFVWDSDTPLNSSLTMAPPTAFGFVGGGTVAPIVINGAGAASGEQPRLQFQGRLNLFGGEIQMDSVGIDATGAAIRLAARGTGQVEIPLMGPTGLVLSGQIDLTNTFIVTTGQGSITLEGGVMTFVGSGLELHNHSAGTAGAIRVESSGDVSFSQGAYLYTTTDAADATAIAGAIVLNAAGDVSILRDGFVGSQSFGSGAAGAVEVNAKNLRLLGQGGWAYLVSESYDAGPSGGITLHVTDRVELIDGGFISTMAFSSGDAGKIHIEANTLTVDGVDRASLIRSESWFNASGRGGDIALKVADKIQILSGGEVSARTRGAGNAGNIDVTAGSLDVDARGAGALRFRWSGIFTEAGPDAVGNSGDIRIRVAGDIKLINEGRISASHAGLWSGDTGRINIEAGGLYIRGNGFLTGVLNDINTSVGKGGDIVLDVKGSMEIVDGFIRSFTLWRANTGQISVHAGSLLISGMGEPSEGAGIRNYATKWSWDGSAGNVSVTVDDGIVMTDHGQISSTSQAYGDAGNVEISAKSLYIHGHGSTTGIFSTTVPRSGNAGSISIDVAGSMELYQGAEVHAASYLSPERVGTIRIHAGSLTSDGMGAFTPIKTTLEFFASGAAGNIIIDVDTTLILRGIAEIASNSFGDGPAGSVSVRAKKILIQGEVGWQTGIGASANPRATGNARSGDITVIADEEIRLETWGYLAIHNFANADSPDQVAMGKLIVVAPRIVLKNDSFISADAVGNVRGSGVEIMCSPDGKGDLEIISDSSSRISSNSRVFSSFEVKANGFDGQPFWAGKADAGDVELRANNIRLSGVTVSSVTGIGSVGNAGGVRVVAAGDVTMLNSRLATDTFASGRAGNVTIVAHDLFVDPSEISSSSHAQATGDAGGVKIELSGKLRVVDGSAISTSTSSLMGRSGAIEITAADVLVDGSGSVVKAVAEAGSSGQTGSVSIIARGDLRIGHGGQVTIANLAGLQDGSGVSPGVLTLKASSVVLDGGSVSAASTGRAAASGIDVQANNQLSLQNLASISTSAQEGDGGPINLSVGGTALVDHSQVITSASGITRGNGGDITIASDTLLMRSGFIQANTQAPQASGGNVRVDVRRLVSAGVLLLGGDQPIDFDPSVEGLNVIQAAAANGVSGNVRVSTPVLDMAGRLVALSTDVLPVTYLRSDLCRAGQGSSFTLLGRGGMRPNLNDALRPEGWQAWLPSATETRLAAAEDYDGDSHALPLLAALSSHEGVCQ